MDEFPTLDDPGGPLDQSKPPSIDEADLPPYDVGDTVPLDISLTKNCSLVASMPIRVKSAMCLESTLRESSPCLKLDPESLRITMCRMSNVPRYWSSPFDQFGSKTQIRRGILAALIHPGCT